MILLSILGLVLLLLIIVLFAPIGYDSDGRYDDSDKDGLLINVHAHWLLRIIRFRFTLKGKQKDKELKVLWIRLMPKEEKEEKPERKKRRKTKKSRKPDRDERTEEQETDEAFGRFEEKISDTEEQGQEDLQEQTQAVKEDDGSKKERVPVFRKISDACDKIKYKFTDICDRIKDGRMKAEDLIEKYSDERTKNAVIELWFVLKRLLWHIRPRRFRMYLHYGMEDPSQTGEIFGIYNSFYPIHRGKPVIVPDFDDKCLEGNYVIKGHIQLFFVLTALTRLYFNKDVKRLYAMIKK